MSDRVGPWESIPFQLVIDGAEFEENDDGTRTLVDGELSHIELVGGDE
jgi:hypothetical protein